MKRTYMVALALFVGLATPVLADSDSHHQGHITGIIPEASSLDYSGVQPNLTCLAFSLDDAGPGKIFTVPSTDPSFAGKSSFLMQAFLTNTAIGFDILPATPGSCGEPQAVRIFAGARVL